MKKHVSDSHLEEIIVDYLNKKALPDNIEPRDFSLNSICDNINFLI